MNDYKLILINTNFPFSCPLQVRERALNAENQNLQDDNDALREQLQQLQLTRTRSEELAIRYARRLNRHDLNTGSESSEE